jgi:hypothetical protein
METAWHAPGLIVLSKWEIMALLRFNRSWASIRLFLAFRETFPEIPGNSRIIPKYSRV